MATLVWDEVGKRYFETGVDRGVLYQSNGKGVAWNGLISVSETFSHNVEPVYFEGNKINDVVTLGAFSGSLTALTYPEEFFEYEGYGRVREGLILSDQPLKRFGLSYRTGIGNDASQDLGYKIHILYNLTAVPTDIDYSTRSDSPEATEFSWDITAIQTPLSGYRPTAHFILDTRYLDSIMVDEIENILYGTPLLDARLPSQQELINFVSEFFIMIIEDNGDGTWTATTNAGYDSLITVDVDDVFTITGANAVYINAQTYEISNALDEE